MGAALLLLAGCAGQPATTAAPAAALAPGMARVWFLRQADPTAGNIYAAAPLVYINREPFVQIRQGTALFHDFPPGRYRLSAQAFGTPASQHDTVQLAPGTEIYVQVEAVANWELGSTLGGYSFAVLPMSADVAKQYLPTLAQLGAR
ncbi:MAG: hypothetical protein WA184_11255 [Stellaceae bacterium]